MKRTLMLMLCQSVVVGAMFAQNKQKEINAIKSNKNYLYATAMSKESSEEASNNSKDLLALEIEQWLKESKADDVAGYVAKSREKLSVINTRRGSLYRVFAYVRKKDILPYYKEEEVIKVDFVEPLYEDSVEVKTNQDSQPTDTSPSSVVEAIENDIREQITLYKPTEKEIEMLGVHTFMALNDYINQGRKEGSIIEVGKYSTMPQTGLAYVFIHNRQSEILACIRLTDGELLNLGTGIKDSFSYYKGCGAIWIKLKNE